MQSEQVTKPHPFFDDCCDAVLHISDELIDSNNIPLSQQASTSPTSISGYPYPLKLKNWDNHLDMLIDRSYHRVSQLREKSNLPFSKATLTANFIRHDTEPTNEVATEEVVISNRINPAITMANAILPEDSQVTFSRTLPHQLMESQTEYTNRLKNGIRDEELARKIGVINPDGFIFTQNKQLLMSEIQTDQKLNKKYFDEFLRYVDTLEDKEDAITIFLEKKNERRNRR